MRRPPLVLQIALHPFADRIMKAGVRSGAAVEALRHKHFWQSDNQRDKEGLLSAWADYEHAFQQMFDFHKQSVEEAYHSGFSDGVMLVPFGVTP